MIAWVAHVYTALGAAAALLATLAVMARDFRAAFMWLGVQVFIDSTDGLVARGVRVKERLPWFDGALLDNIIDYLTFVLVPVLILLQADLLPERWRLWIAIAVMMASAFGFSRADAKVKTTDYFFTGFPSYWNIVALYLFVLRFPAAINALVVTALVILVFVPLRYVYPSRTQTLRPLTLGLALVWGAIVFWMIWRLPATGGPWPALSLVFPIYYVGLSLWLDRKSRH